MKRLASTISFLYALLGISALPKEEGKLAFDEEQKQKITEALGEKDYSLLVARINKELKSEVDSKAEKDALKDQIAAARAEFRSSLEGSGYTEEEIAEMAGEGSNSDLGQHSAKPDSVEPNAALDSLVADFTAYRKKTDAMIKKLVEEEEPDKHKNAKNMNLGIAHSATHLFAQNSAVMAFDGRNWNRRAAGISKTKTDWNGTAGKVNVEKLNGDVDLYFRENPSTIDSLHRDMLELPSFWPRRINVSDQVADGRIVSDEVTQVRKLPWLAKNKQKIQPEVRKVFPVSIDVEWTGNDLQSLEESWLNRFVDNGSGPYKMAFVQFLVSELMKKARNEDRISSVKGVHVETPDNATVAGRFINRQDGLLYQLFRAVYADKKVKVPSLGLPTAENIVDYVEATVRENLTEEIRENTDLVYYMEPDHIKLYRTRKKELFGNYKTTTTADYDTIENYTNIRMVPLHDLAGTNVHFITFDDNIEILENLPNEKSILTFQMLRRMIYGHGDYKYGVGFKHLGTEVEEGDPDAFKVQSVWTNGVFPFKKDFFIPFFDNATGKLVVKYSNLVIQSGFETNITALDKTNLFEGQIVKIKGNTSGVTASLVHNTTFILAGDANFDLSSGGTITLVVDAALNLKELSRTTAPAINAAEIHEFSGAVIDVKDGLNQAFNGSATTVTGIENGNYNQKLTITNVTAPTANLTVSNVVGNIAVASNAVIKAGDELVLIFVDGVWVEYSRTIA